MRTKKPYPVFVEPRELTDDTPVMGIPGKIWDKALTGNFVANLQEGNQILRLLEEQEQTKANYLSSATFDAVVLAQAVTVFGNEQAAHAWMTAPVISLANRPPVELCATPAGSDHVLTYLWRIKSGIDC